MICSQINKLREQLIKSLLLNQIPNSWPQYLAFRLLCFLCSRTQWFAYQLNDGEGFQWITNYSNFCKIFPQTYMTSEELEHDFYGAFVPDMKVKSSSLHWFSLHGKERPGYSSKIHIPHFSKERGSYVFETSRGVHVSEENTCVIIWSRCKWFL